MPSRCPLLALRAYARRAVARTQRIVIFPGATRAVRRKPTGNLRSAYLIRGCGLGENRKAIPNFGSLPAPTARPLRRTSSEDELENTVGKTRTGCRSCVILYFAVPGSVCVQNPQTTLGKTLRVGAAPTQTGRRKAGRKAAQPRAPHTDCPIGKAPGRALVQNLRDGVYFHSFWLQHVDFSLSPACSPVF